MIPDKLTTSQLCAVDTCHLCRHMSPNNEDIITLITRKLSPIAVVTSGTGRHLAAAMWQSVLSQCHIRVSLCVCHHI